MTIKQQGGIFGRNPSFNDLEANTAYVVDELGVGESNPARVVHIKASVPAIRLEDSDVAGLYHEFLATAGGQFQFKADGGNVQASSTIGMVVDGTLVGTFGSTGLAFLSGQGIDFSATSGTGTSELFDDYEEGTFTPTLTTSGTDFDSVTYDSLRGGRYTKIGNTVHFQLYIATDAVTAGSASGNVVIGNLPFTATTHSSGTADGSSAVTVGFTSAWGGENPIEAFVNNNSTNILIYYRATSDVSSSAVQVSDVGTTPNDNQIRIAGTYIAA